MSTNEFGGGGGGGGGGDGGDGGGGGVNQEWFFFCLEKAEKFTQAKHKFVCSAVKK